MEQVGGEQASVTLSPLILSRWNLKLGKTAPFQLSHFSEELQLLKQSIGHWKKDQAYMHNVIHLWWQLYDEDENGHNLRVLQMTGYSFSFWLAAQIAIRWKGQNTSQKHTNTFLTVQCTAEGRRNSRHQDRRYSFHSGSASVLSSSCSRSRRASWTII